MKLLNAGSAEQPLTIAHPDPIMPARSSLAIQGNRLEDVMPGYSIQVLEFDVK